MKTVPILRTRRCLLSQIKESELEELHRIMMDEDVKRFLPEFYDMIKSEKAFRAVMNSFAVLCNDKKAVIWGIHIRDKLVGFVGLMDFPVNATMFYSIHKAFRRNGLVTESVAAVIDYMTEMQMTTSVQTEVLKNNIASISVLLHNGFVESSRMEDKLCMKRRL